METKVDIENNRQSIFKEENGEPKAKPMSFDVKDYRIHADDALIMIQENVSYSHNDQNLRPILLIKTQGLFSNFTEIEKVWLSIFDL